MQMCTNKYIALFIFPGGKMCFDSFIAISCWFLVSQNFKTERFLKMWLEVLFYSIITMVAATYMGSALSKKEWISGLMPITGSVQGYAATYLAFYLTLPVLSTVKSKISKIQNMFVILILTIYVFLSRFMGMFGTEQSVYCRLILFIYIYFIMLYLKNNPVKLLNSKWAMLSLFVLCWILVYGYYYGAITHPNSMWWTYLAILVLDEGGILYFVGGLALFFFFKSITVKPNKIINILGGTTLAVLLIHDGHFFRGTVWNMLKTTEWWYSKRYVLYVLLCVIGIYVVCSVFDLLRKYFIEKTVFKNKYINRVCKKIDDLLLAEIEDT